MKATDDTLLCCIAGRLHLLPYMATGAGPSPSMTDNTLGGAASGGVPTAALGTLSLGGQQVLRWNPQFVCTPMQMLQQGAAHCM